MTTTPVPSPPGAGSGRGRDQRDVRLAWACLAAALPVSALAFAAGEGLATAMGDDGVGAAPWRVAATVLLATAAVLAVPALLAVRFARRAHTAGDDRARVPAVVLVVGTIAFVTVNVVSYALMVLAG